jgi:hypothetical protein
VGSVNAGAGAGTGGAGVAATTMDGDDATLPEVGIAGAD